VRELRGCGYAVGGVGAESHYARRDPDSACVAAASAANAASYLSSRPGRAGSNHRSEPRGSPKTTLGKTPGLAPGAGLRRRRAPVDPRSTELVTSPKGQLTPRVWTDVRLAESQHL